MKIPKISSRASLFLLLLIISVLTIVPYLGLTNFHTKGEPREAIVAVSMLQNNNWILPINNGSDIAYKPPFFHWCIAALSLPTGEVTEFTSRLPSALAAIVMTLACFLFFAKRSRNDLAFLASLLLLSGFEVHRAAMASRVDMVLTCFIVLALLQLYRWWEHRLKGIPIWAILFMSIATLTKGPVGIILPCAVLGVFLLLQKISLWKTIYKIVPIALLSCLLPFGWYYAAYQQGGDTFLQLVMEENFARFMGKMSYDSHEQPIVYYLYITLAGWLPWSLLAIMSLFVLKYKKPQGTVKQYWAKFKAYITHMDKMRLFSLLSIVVIFVFYCIPKSKRSVYILPIYPFIAYFLAEYMFFLLKQRHRIWRIFSIFIAIVGALLLAVLVLIKSGIVNNFQNALPDDINHYIVALSESWNIVSIVAAIAIVFLIYDIYKSKRYLTYNNRYIYSVIALFFGIQLMLDVSTLPAILNAKSMKPFADKVIATVPEGKIYSYVSTPMMHFFIINFYAQDRVVEFEKEMPDHGQLLVGEKDYVYIQEKYGEHYAFTPVLKSERKGNDVKDFVLLLDFQKQNPEKEGEK
ncbi:MAG TPA: glycosyltransferase family 39 protein [Candidatus Barnesiella excrementigallinarum]|nr:glycosyltransferase family 39 protein [Candidatus Barnesiella excrementigallinarum]